MLLLPNKNNNNNSSSLIKNTSSISQYRKNHPNIDTTKSIIIDDMINKILNQLDLYRVACCR